MDSETHSTLCDVDPATPDTTGAPSVAGVSLAFPPHRHTQEELSSTLADIAGLDIQRFATSSGVSTPPLALPLSRYGELSGFTEANDTYLDIALELGERALVSALAKAGVEPSDVDVIFSTTVTGITVPSLEGAGALIATGADRTPAGPKVLATRSRTYPDTENALGWKIGSDGFGIVLSAEIATIVEKYLGDDVRKFLAEHGLSTA